VTQGLVSICVAGKVVLKFVAGNDGYNAEKVGARIKSSGLPRSLEDAHRLAIDEGFGCDDCLVVLDAEQSFFKGDDELSYLYRSTFSEPGFNPRWSRGTCEYLCVVDMKESS
jgi:hypothetical protein